MRPWPSPAGVPAVFSDDVRFVRAPPVGPHRPDPTFARAPALALRAGSSGGASDHGDRRLGLRPPTSAADPLPLVELAHVPMTLAGLSRFNVENTLAAASAALALGIPRRRWSRGTSRSVRTPSTTRAG